MSVGKALKQAMDEVDGCMDRLLEQVNIVSAHMISLESQIDSGKIINKCQLETFAKGIDKKQGR